MSKNKFLDFRFCHLFDIWILTSDILIVVFSFSFSLSKLK